MKSNYVDLCKTGKNIRDLCEKNGLTIQDLQKYLNLACPQSIYRWLRGEALPTVDHLLRMSKVFHVPMEEILVETETSKNE